MAVSQFTIYTSSDPGGPGFLTGTTGSLVSILDACLVNGYTNKPAAGWTKPIATLSSSLSSYRPPSGSRMNLFINDSGPQSGSLAREAWACGFETLTSLTGSTGAGSIFTGSYGNGFGTGQFPLPSQQLTFGHVVWRKSTSADLVGRSWIIAADAYSFYLWVITGDTLSPVPVYYMSSFGDIYSNKGPTDLYRALITGRVADNTSGGGNNDFQDCISANNVLTSAQPAHYTARSYTGTGFSIGVTKKADTGVANGTTGTTPASSALAGVLQTPNAVDGSMCITPILIVEPLSVMVRGKWRGLYQLCHPVANFGDGQIIQGTGDFAGKTFLVVKLGPNTSIWLLEISNTLDTN